MKYLVSLSLLVAAVLAAQSFGGEEQDRAIERRLRAHAWRVEFANGVVQTNEFRDYGVASVSEPQRRAAGDVTYEAGAAVVTYGDNRTERWTLVGHRFVVEHWAPSSAMGSARGVLGIAEKAKTE